MSDINLLPENLRDSSPEAAKKIEDDIRYTDPRREVKLQDRPARPAKAAGFWRKFLNKLGKKNKNQSAAKPPSADLKVSGVANGRPPVSGVSSNGGGEPKMHLPQKQNGNLNKGPEVDLAEDKTLLFSLAEFYYRLKIGSIILVLMLVALGVLYAVIIKMQEPLQTSSQDLQQEIIKAQTDITNFSKEKDKMVALDQRLVRINDLLNRHLFWTKMFSLLENNTLNDVYYTSLTVDQGGKVVLSAVAKDYPAAAEQLAVWQNRPEVKSVEFSQAILVKAKNQAPPTTDKSATKPETEVVSFDLILDFDQQFLTDKNYGVK